MGGRIESEGIVMAKIKVCDKAYENIKKKVEEMQEELAKDVCERMTKDMLKETPIVNVELQTHESDNEVNEDELVGYIMRKTGNSLNLCYEEVRAVLDAEIEFLKEKGIAE